MKKEELIKRLEAQLADVAAERLAAKREPALLDARTALKRFQSGRLAETHADLLVAPDTHAAAEFFLDELYGAHDLSQRDLDLGRIIPTLGRMLSYEALHTITDAIMLDAMSEKLDTAMARALGTAITNDRYMTAYRHITTQDERERQLTLVEQLGRSLCELVRAPLVSVTLSVMRGPARLAGLSQLHEFLHTGFSSFKKMRQPQLFVETIVARERKAMQNIYAGVKNPFEVA